MMSLVTAAKIPPRRTLKKKLTNVDSVPLSLRTPSCHAAKKKPMNTLDPSENIANSEEGIVSVNDIPVDVLANHIFPFVGGDQYLFVGGVSRHYEEAYSATFPAKTTRYNMTTMKFAKICWETTEDENKPFVQELAKNQTWYRTISWDDLDDEDWAMLKWTRSTFGCIWETVIAPDTKSYAACEVAAARGQLDALKRARKNRCPWGEVTCQLAAKNGHFEVLKWAHTNGCPWDEGTCKAAAAGGHLDVLKWARKMNCPWDETTCAAAAAGGHLNVLMWLRTHKKLWNGKTYQGHNEDRYRSTRACMMVDDKCPWNLKTCEVAASGGHLDVLKWARIHGCDWSESTCEAAAAGGHLRTLKWARRNNCPWNKNTCLVAAKYGRLEVLKWARSNGCPWNEDDCSQAAAAYGHVAVVQWACRIGGSAAL
jgi:hypothetical protein